jgi:hypothetical protein
MHQRFAAAATVKNQFNRILKGDTLAIGATAVIEVMILFIFQPHIKLLEYAAFLA